MCLRIGCHDLIKVLGLARNNRKRTTWEALRGRACLEIGCCKRGWSYLFIICIPPREKLLRRWHLTLECRRTHMFTPTCAHTQAPTLFSPHYVGRKHFSTRYHQPPYLTDTQAGMRACKQTNKHTHHHCPLLSLTVMIKHTDSFTMAILEITKIEAPLTGEGDVGSR